MDIENLSYEEMRSALKALQLAGLAHESWADQLNATLVCRLAADVSATTDSGERGCAFTEWYQGPGVSALGRHMIFEEIGREHAVVHQCSAVLLQASRTCVAITPQNYGEFLTANNRFRRKLVILEHEMEESLYALDPLTGTLNRAGMLATLREQQELVRRNVHPTSIAMMDVDEFKQINDAYGHAAGDQVLIAFARHLLSHVRPYDKVFRYGGDEFLLCLPNADIETTLDIVERLRGELAAFSLEAGEGRRFQATVSFGLSPIDAEFTVENCINRADRGLYAAKTMGRNRAVIGPPR